MNRIAAISNTFSGLTKAKFSDLSMGAQVSLVYGSLKRALNTVKWYTEQADSAEKAGEHDKWKYFSAQAFVVKQVCPGMFVFLNRAANYSEAVDAVIEWDNSSVDEMGLSHEDVEWVTTALNGKPHAWAKRLLIDAGQWPTEGFDFSRDYKLVLYKDGEVATRIAGRLIGRMVHAYFTDDEYRPRPTDGRDIEIAALSPECLAISRCSKPEVLAQKSLLLAQNNPPFIDGNPVKRDEISSMWRALVERDDDDRAEAELRALKKEVKAGVRDMLRATTLTQALAEGLERLKGAGASEQTLAAFTQSMTAKL